MKDNEIAALVNQLRDIAIQCKHAGQLRAQIAKVVVPPLQLGQAYQRDFEKAVRWVKFHAETFPELATMSPEGAISHLVVELAARHEKFADDATQVDIEAAERRAALYEDDPRQDIKTDVMNAFYAGIAHARASEAEIRAKIARELRSSAFLHCDVNKEHVLLAIEHGADWGKHLPEDDPLRRDAAARNSFLGKWSEVIKGLPMDGEPECNGSHDYGRIAEGEPECTTCTGEATPSPRVEWDKFPAWLIDHCEGETITEEFLQRALADMLKAHPPAASKRGNCGYGDCDADATVDSGGTQPWGDPVRVPCPECNDEGYHFRGSGEDSECGTCTDKQPDDRQQLELINRCDPSWLILHLKENTSFDAALLEKVFALAKERAAAMLLKVGDSSFEGWFSTYNPAGKGDKQRARDAYAAGMEDPRVTVSKEPGNA